MTTVLADEEIARLVLEAKHLPDDYHDRIKPRPKRGHREGELRVIGAQNSEFRVITRQSYSDPFDFSVILVYDVPRTNRRFRLRRYNGKSHEHTNKIEDETFFDFHIHMATERYQDRGFNEDAYAKPTERYWDLDSAIDCMVEDCGFQMPAKQQLSLF